MNSLEFLNKLVEESKVLITGGAGFIGSHLVDVLMKLGVRVRVFDNLSSGRLENLNSWLGNPRFEFRNGDLLDVDKVFKAVEDSCIVFHLAANPEVRSSSINPIRHFRENVVTTLNLLEAIRKVGNVKMFIFTSSSTVYGEANNVPTSEDYAPLKPISVYGATKLACEGLISAYAHTFGFKAIIYRLANIIGPRSKHGVVYDFVSKLRNNPKILEILGDGTQKKSYLYVTDCIKAILLGLKRPGEYVEIYNVGSDDQVDVKTIAQIVVEEMGLKQVRFIFTGGVDGGRGWKGDVKNMLLDTTKLKSLGWRPRYNSVQAVRKTVKELLTESTQ